MNKRERFRETLLFGSPDRIPLEPGHPRESTLEAWHQQGLPEDIDWHDYLMQVLGIRHEPTQPRVDLGVSFQMIPTFEEVTQVKRRYLLMEYVYLHLILQPQIMSPRGDDIVRFCLGIRPAGTCHGQADGVSARVWVDMGRVLIVAGGCAVAKIP